MALATVVIIGSSGATFTILLAILAGLFYEVEGNVLRDSGLYYAMLVSALLSIVPLGIVLFLSREDRQKLDNMAADMKKTKKDMGEVKKDIGKINDKLDKLRPDS